MHSVLYVYIGLSAVIFIVIVLINAQLQMYRIVYSKSKCFVLTIPFNLQLVACVYRIPFCYGWMVAI